MENTKFQNDAARTGRYYVKETGRVHVLVSPEGREVSRSMNGAKLRRAADGLNAMRDRNEDKTA